MTADSGHKSYFVHKNLLAGQSALLQKTVDAAGQDRKIDLQSWDSETVGLFVDFLYLRTYEAPKPELRCQTLDSSQDTDSNATETGSRAHTPETVRSESTVHQDDYSDQTAPRPLTPLSGFLRSDDLSNATEPAGREQENCYSTLYPSETYDYQGCLLSHAKVYALADAMGIEMLQSIAYHRLSVLLAGLDPGGQRSVFACNTAGLLRYVYANIYPPGDRMRKLVSHFAVWGFRDMNRTDEMKKLVREGGDLAVDLVENLCRRLVLDDKATSSNGELVTTEGEVATTEGEVGRSDHYRGKGEILWPRWPPALLDRPAGGRGGGRGG